MSTINRLDALESRVRSAAARLESLKARPLSPTVEFVNLAIIDWAQRHGIKASDLSAEQIAAAVQSGRRGIK